MPAPASTASPVFTACADGNEAAADVAYRLNELCALYPITPSSPMGELADEWSGAGRRNLWGGLPQVVEMQSEGGAAATLHGALQSGSLATTFTSSQGLLLMLPSLFKIAGELCPCVIHVAARAVATHALSIFGDHSDVMAVRGCGFALLSAGGVQEAHDFALAAQAVSLRTRVPFLHFFDGFRSSHELRGFHRLEDDDLRALVDEADVRTHRARALNPDHPVLRGTSQNPDVFFQSREAANPFYDALPAVLDAFWEALAARTGRRYASVEYSGHPEAERVVVIMGSGGETVAETAAHLQRQEEKVGVLRVRLYRPWPAEALLRALPGSVRALAVLDRCKEPGGFGEPLFLDVAANLQQQGLALRVCGGRYGLGSKEFTPAMAKAVFDLLRQPNPPPRFTVGIHDDVSGLSLPVDPAFHLEDADTTRALFYGLGSDGTVGANKQTVKILSQLPGMHAQGYFVYDSNKSGARTISHLRFGRRPIRAPYLIQSANFIACHCFAFVQQIDLLERAAAGSVLLLNCPHPPETVLSRLPAELLHRLKELRMRLWVIDASRVARECGLGGRINTLMQTCFFALSGVLPKEEALEAVRGAAREAYARKGEETVNRNLHAVDRALDALREVPIPETLPDNLPRPPTVPPEAPRFVREVTARLLSGQGDLLPVSALPPDGTWPLDTARWSQRDLSTLAPVWEPDLCIQCGHCAVICPHGVIRIKQAAEADLTSAPVEFPAPPLRGGEIEGRRYLLQLNLPQCTGCGLCVEICPARSKTQANLKALHQEERAPRLERERIHWEFFRGVPARHEQTQSRTLRGVQFLDGYFEYPGACAGCGETAVLRLLSQLFGDRMLVANATGCSSIYGGNLPTTPWSTDEAGRGPAWANSLFEDNAEFGLGFRLSMDLQRRRAEELLRELAGQGISTELAEALIAAPMDTAAEIAAQRARLEQLRSELTLLSGDDRAGRLEGVADSLVDRAVWIVGGDGWACDIGFGGLDHVLASGHNVNILVLDTEVYSNTGGQASKSTPLGAVAKFAAGGKTTAKSDLALHGMLKGKVYVGTIALGANLPQALKVLREAEAWKGPSLVIAYSPCIAHGYPLRDSLEHQKMAVESGTWPLLRYQPAREGAGEGVLQLDSPDPPIRPLRDLMSAELRFKLLEHSRPETAAALLVQAERDIRQRLRRFRALQASAAESPPRTP